jgi:hypothetical protein
LQTVRLAIRFLPQPQRGLQPTALKRQKERKQQKTVRTLFRFFSYFIPQFIFGWFIKEV